MTVLFSIVTGCFLVGLCIGWCGVAGFLLPILFMGKCGLSPSQSLFLAFLCFAVSGMIGSAGYSKRGELPKKAAWILGLSSLAGSLAGALLGRQYVSAYIKIVLYLVVLISGIMILVQEAILRSRSDRPVVPFDSPAVLAMIGFLCAIICSLSGAGGPVLVMPLLVLMGFPVRTAVGTALFDSIFIAIPAIIIYGNQADLHGLANITLLAVISHAAGIWLGSSTAGKIP